MSQSSSSSIYANRKSDSASICDSGISIASARQASTTSGLRGGGRPKRIISTSMSMNSEDLSSRRRSSIAFIPQMQVCPGDLLVDDWQLNELVNQSNENGVTNQFPKIEKAKSHIWSPFKLCAHHESRAMRVLSRLEDVLSSHKPSIFIDEQLLRYKGMDWNEFLCEFESQLSFEQGECNDKKNEPGTSAPVKGNQSLVSSHERSSQPVSGQPVENSISGGAGATRQTVKGRKSSRMTRRPKLERGQTVDSVFRVPLNSSSSLKHALPHQETPTAYLEDQTSQLVSVDEHEGQSASTSGSTSSDADLTDASCQPNCRNNFRPTPSRTSPKRVFVNQSTNKSSFEAISGPISTNKGKHLGKLSISTLSSTVSRKEQKRQLALWDLFQSECTFFFDHLMTLKNVYMEPLKIIQVEDIAMFAQPDVLFGNLDELCCGVYDFCKEFLEIIIHTLRTCPEKLNATEVLIMLYKENKNIYYLRTLYQRYTLSYIKALTHLECLRRHKEFLEFERLASNDPRCNKLHLTDLLVAPVQHIMRVPIILKDIESHSENSQDRQEIRAILAVEEAFLREVDDKMRWLKNFERLREIQRNISWPSVLETEPKFYLPEDLREVLREQPCQNLIASPRRRIVQEGTLANLDANGKPSYLHLVLFEDMLLMLCKKNSLIKRASTICKTNLGATSTKDEANFKYTVYKQPLGLDRFHVYDVHSQATGAKYLFVLVAFNRFKQIINAYSLSAPDEETKQTWLLNLKETADRWKQSSSVGSNSN